MRDIRTLLISNERDSILSIAEQSTAHGEVQGIFHTNQQQDVHESLLQILHNNTKIDPFPGLAFLSISLQRADIYGRKVCGQD